ncbi:MAG: SAM-dependent methyltransferase, partial [Candidatus Bathyarchaeia archaeon]
MKNSENGEEGKIEIFKEYEGGLEGIDGFSHLMIITYLHKVKEEEKKVLKVRFKRLLRFGIKPEEIPEVGVFCSDSPHRPVPIALTIVRLIRREGGRLYVKDLDLFDGTPILDIKPYTLERIIKELKLPKWYEK